MLQKKIIFEGKSPPYLRFLLQGNHFCRSVVQAFVTLKALGPLLAPAHADAAHDDRYDQQHCDGWDDDVQDL